MKQSQFAKRWESETSYEKELGALRILQSIPQVYIILTTQNDILSGLRTNGVTFNWNKFFNAIDADI